MKAFRNKHGSSMAIIALSLIVIVILGVAFYYFSRMFGAGRETADGVDGGALGVARHASKQVGVNLIATGTSDPYDIQQFLPLTDPPVAINPGSTNINVLTYNRLVAQAMLVSINAASMGTSQATANSAKVWSSVKYVGQQLTNSLSNASYFQNSFNIIANQGNTSMLGINGSNAVSFNSNQYAVGYMRNGYASNIYVPQDLINNFSNPSPDDAFSSVASTLLPALNGMMATSPGNTNTGSLTFPVGTTSYGVSLTGAPASTSNNPSGSPFSSSGPGFLAGYKSIPAILTGMPNYPGFVPIVPGNAPHLVSKQEFQAQTQASPVISGNYNQFIPPNAYQSGGTASQNVANSSVNTVANAVACAVVGCPTSSISGVNGSNYNSSLLTSVLPTGSTSSIQTLVGQYPMQIPGGYIRLDNMPGLQPPPGQMMVNGTNDIFNNQLYYNGIAQANLDGTGNGVYSASAEGQGIIQAWATYNAAAAAGPHMTPGTPVTPGTPASAGPPAVAAVPPTPAVPGVPINYYPPDNNVPPSIANLYPPNLPASGMPNGFMCTPGSIDPQSGYPYLIYGTAGAASASQIYSITSLAAFCQTPANYPPGGPTPSLCGSQLNTWTTYFSTPGGSPTGTASGNNYNVVEYLKGYLLVERGPECGNGLLGVTISNTSGGSGGALNGATTGMHLTPMVSSSGVQQIPFRQPTQNNHFGAQYSIPGNPIQLLTAVGNPTGKSLQYTVNDSSLANNTSTISCKSKSSNIFSFIDFMQPANAAASSSGPGSSVTTVSGAATPIPPGTALYNIYQRCREIKPGVTPDEIIAALDTTSPLEMGASMYLYVNPISGMFTCDSIGPKNYYQSFSSAYSDQNTINANIIDGTLPTGTVTVSNLASNQGAQQNLAQTGNLVMYNATDTLIDTKAELSNGQGNGYPYPPNGVAAALLGDAEYHDQPFTVHPSITAMDAAVWIPCSGYHNLLGIVQFQTTVPVLPGSINLSSNPSNPNNITTSAGGSYGAPN